MTIACPVLALFSLDERQWIETRAFIVLRRARPWIIIAVSTSRLAHSPAPAATPQLTGQIAVYQGTGRR